VIHQGPEGGRVGSLQQWLVKTGGWLAKGARHYSLLLAEGHLTRPVFSAISRGFGSCSYRRAESWRLAGAKE
jgi:hypothetical protein